MIQRRLALQRASPATRQRSKRLGSNSERNPHINRPLFATLGSKEATPMRLATGRPPTCALQNEAFHRKASRLSAGSRHELFGYAVGHVGGVCRGVFGRTRDLV